MSVSVWFITDGEPTYYMASPNHESAHGKGDYIPTSKSHAQYGFFNVRNSGGLTEYEEMLCARLSNTSFSLRKLGVELAYHFCIFGVWGKSGFFLAFSPRALTLSFARRGHAAVHACSLDCQ